MQNTTYISVSIRQAADACTDLAQKFLELGRNRWIEVAIDEGWTHNLRESARSIAFETWRRGCLKTDRIEPVPSLVDIDAAVQFKPEDHAYFRQYGRDINRVDLYYACKSRAERNSINYPILSEPPPSITHETAELVRMFKAAMSGFERRSKPSRRATA